MIDRCHNVRDRGELIHIPGCMGCAAMGHGRCTCKTSPSPGADRIARLERRVERLERAVRRLSGRRKA